MTCPIRLTQVPGITRRHRLPPGSKELPAPVISGSYTTQILCLKQLCLSNRYEGVYGFQRYMTAQSLSFIVEALSKLEKAVESAALSLKSANVRDPAILSRISSYKEIIRRQHALLGDLKRATAREDWKEVSRITNLVHGSSLMIKVDAGFLISNMKVQGASSGASHR